MTCTDTQAGILLNDIFCYSGTRANSDAFVCHIIPNTSKKISVFVAEEPESVKYPNKQCDDNRPLIFNSDEVSILTF